MALIHCYECGKKISETAPTCPECGAKQHTKSTGGKYILIALVIAIIGTGGYFCIQHFSKSGDSNKVNIPDGNYTLVKSQSKGFTGKAIHFIENLSVNAKGLGSSIKVVGDTLQSDGIISDAVTSFTGGSNRFHIEKGNEDNGYILDMPGNDKIPIHYNASDQSIIMHMTGDSLVYQKTN